MATAQQLLVGEFVPTESYKKASDLPRRGYEMVRAIRWAFARYEEDPLRPLNTLHFIGPHGTGKTSQAESIARECGLRVVSISMANQDSTAFVIPFPERQKDDTFTLTQMLVESIKQLDPDDKFVILLDEFTRGDKTGMNIAMELTGSRTIAGMPLPGLVAVIALSNPQGNDAFSGITGMDLAQGDRFNTWKVSANDTLWEYAIARENPDIDLKPLFKEWWNLTDEQKFHLPPRVLSFVIRLARHGLPAKLALPVLASGRVKLMGGDRDQTKVVLNKLLGSVNLPNEDEIRGAQVPVLLDFADSTNSNVRIIGPQGCGKTEFVKDYLTRKTKDVVTYSLTISTPEDFAVPIPADGKLNFVLMDRLVHDRPWVLLADELSRPDRRTAAAFMEISGQRTMAGQPLENLAYIVGLDNPSRIGDIRFDAGRIDEAQASRYAATAEINWDDIPAREFLDSQYGTAASPFALWWSEDLDDNARALVSFRCLERMIVLAHGGLDPSAALPWVDGEQVPVAGHMIALKARLKNQPVAGLTQIVREVDDFEAALRDGDERLEATVLFAFKKADHIELERHIDVVARIIGLLGKEKKMSLVLHSSDKRREILANALRMWKANNKELAAEIEAKEKAEKERGKLV